MQPMIMVLCILYPAFLAAVDFYTEIGFSIFFMRSAISLPHFQLIIKSEPLIISNECYIKDVWFH
jgi:hypothetical protein